MKIKLGILVICNNLHIGKHEQRAEQNGMEKTY